MEALSGANTVVGPAGGNAKWHSEVRPRLSLLSRGRAQADASDVPTMTSQPVEREGPWQGLSTKYTGSYSISVAGVSGRQQTQKN